MGYQGLHRHTLDPATGRVAIPARFRRLTPEEANGTFTITRGIEKCLCLYPVDVWKRDTESLTSLPYTRTSVRRVQRWMFGESERVVVDDQGRIVIPKHLLEYAQIGNEVLLIGLVNKIEIWDPELYRTAMEKSDATLEQDLEEIEALKNKNQAPGK
jgi:MraZ protein